MSGVPRSLRHRVLWYNEAMILQVGIKALIKNTSNQYLFLHRTAHVTDGEEELWDIPGGRINPDEPVIEALKREIREEIGVSIKSVPKLLAAQDIFVEPKDLHVVRLVYIVEEAISKITLSDEHDVYRWVDQADLNSIKAEPKLAEILQSL